MRMTNFEIRRRWRIDGERGDGGREERRRVDGRLLLGEGKLVAPASAFGCNDLLALSRALLSDSRRRSMVGVLLLLNGNLKVRGPARYEVGQCFD
jgi:hypothetical protein